MQYHFFILATLLLLFSGCKNDLTQTTQTDPFAYLFIGTYTRPEPHVNGKAEGVYVYKMNKKTGTLTYVNQSPLTINPSFVAPHPNKRWLFAVNEHGGTEENPSGTISAFSIDSLTKSLQLINTVSARGIAPCHISIDATGKFALVANYVGGNVIMLPIANDGMLGEAIADIKHEGIGTTPRQEAPHAHFIAPDLDNRFAYAVDLGIDKILIYQMDLEKGGLLEAEKPFIKTQAGAGSRHLAFHPNKKWIYVVNELNGSIECFNRSENGVLSSFQLIGTTSDSLNNGAACADIHITPNGKFLYASNRGDFNNLAMYSIDANSGVLTSLGYQSTFGKTPRNFVIDPSGTFLLVANQDSDNVVTFRIDPQTGILQKAGMDTKIPTPVCLKFSP